MGCFREESIPWLLQLLVVADIPWFMASALKSLLPFLHGLLPKFNTFVTLLKNSCDYIWLTFESRIISPHQIFKWITSAKSLFPWKITCLMILGIRAYLWGPLFCLAQTHSLYFNFNSYFKMNTKLYVTFCFLCKKILLTYWHIGQMLIFLFLSSLVIMFLVSTQGWVLSIFIKYNQFYFIS